MSEENKKQSFLFGLVTGIAIISVIAVAVLLTRGSTATGIGDNSKVAEKAEQKPSKLNDDPTQVRQAGKITINSNDRIRGDKNAPVTLVEFSDFQCPYCQRFHPTMKRVMDEYEGKVRWIYRHFPLGFHQNAQKSAEASECAGDQGKFWEYSDKLFENSKANGDGLHEKDLKKYAKEMGLNTDKFNKCLSSDKFAGKVKADMASGQAAGVSGTPGTILIDKDGNTELISGALPFAQVKAKIDAALN